MAIQNLYPNQRPSLDLNFVGSKTVDPRITFTRASSATYFDEFGVMRSAPNNVPRIDHNPSTGECLGLLIEEQRSNLLTYSEQFDNAIWTKTNSGGTLTYNVLTAPDGTLTADLWVENTSNAGRAVSQGASFVAGTVYTASVFAKRGDGARNVGILLGSGAFGNSINAAYDLSGNGSASVSIGPATATIQSVGGGWYRCTLTATATTTVVAHTQIRLTNSSTNANTTYTGDGTSGIYLWGAQLEAGAFPTSYIPTTAVFTSRNSTGAYFDSTGVMKTAAINEPRYDHGLVSGQWVRKGLLLEDSATNLLTYSEQFNNAVWAKSATSITQNAVIAPDGTLTADKLIESTAAGQHYISQSVSVQSNTSYAPSVFVKAAERTKCRVIVAGVDWSSSSVVDIDLTNGTLLYSVGTVYVVPAGNGWYRVSVVGVTGSTTALRGLLVLLLDGASNASYTGDGTSGIYVWGAQLEEGSFPTSYIKTEASQVTRADDVSTSSQVTRAADSAVMTGANFSSWYNIPEGTIVWKGAILENGVFNTGGNKFSSLFDIDNGTSTSNTSHGVLASAGYGPGLSVSVSDSAVTRSRTIANPLPDSNVNLALAYSQVSSGTAVDGTYYGFGSELTQAPVPATRLTIGSLNGGVGTSSLTAHIKRLSYYPRRLSNDQLVALTT